MSTTTTTLGDNTKPRQLIWLVTGAASGLGSQLCLAILSRGDKVIATTRARSMGLLSTLPSSSPSSISPNDAKENFEALAMDITSPFEDIQKAAASAIEIWGHVDVVVNNAGIVPAEVVEETGVGGILNVFETNFFGAVKVTNAFLPHFRQRREGTLIFVGSRQAYRTAVPLIAAYSSSKAALHALADTIRAETTPFGIRVLTIIPGGFRTNSIRTTSYENRLTSNTSNSEEDKNTESGKQELEGAEDVEFALSLYPFLSLAHSSIPDYRPINASGLRFLKNTAGKQPGDPSKAGSIIVDVVRGEGVAKGREFPPWLLLGQDCVKDAREKIGAIERNAEEWEGVSCSTDF